MIYIKNIIISIVLGIIEGITEFFPISSTGHVIIISCLLNTENTNIKILTIFSQLGSSFATLIYLYQKIINLLKLNKIKTIKIFIISILPTILIGFFCYHLIKSSSNPKNVMYGLIFGSIFLICSQMLQTDKCPINSLKKITILQSFIIGCMQIFSLYPGVSRSGSTISTGILLGLKKSIAIDFSFIISIPLIIGASVFDLIKHIKNINIFNMFYCFIAFFTSFLISIIFFKSLIKILNTTSLIFFGFYRFLLSLIIFLMY